GPATGCARSGSARPNCSTCSAADRPERRRPSSGAGLAFCAMPAPPAGGILAAGAVMERWTRRAFLAAGLSLGACTRLERPPLGVLYGQSRGAPDQPPLVLIPGAFGSSLRDRRTGREIWPGSSAALLASNYRGLELDIDPATLEPLAEDVEAYDLFEA